MSTEAGQAKKKKTKKKGRKAPGMLSFVVWRQFFMVLAAPYAASALMPVFNMQDSWIAMLIAVAVPSLLHGLDSRGFEARDRRGADVVRNLRIGQIVAGGVHIGLVGWALSMLLTGQMIMGDSPGQTSGFFVGLAIAGLAAGIWETVRPIMELRDPPEVKEAAARKAARAAAKAKQQAEQAAAAQEQPEAEAQPDASTDAAAPTDGESSEDPADVATEEKPAVTE